MSLFSDEVDDVATVSNFREVVITKIHLDLDVCFDTKFIKSKAKLSFRTLRPTSKIQLDIHETLEVSAIQIQCRNDVKQTDLEFECKPFSGYGSELNIKLTGVQLSQGDEFDIFINYKATGGPGVCWLEPEQTAGKTKPYMYTQGQAVMNRSFFPCQDTPAVKFPYTANVKVPEGFTPVMSASIGAQYGSTPNLSGETDNYFFSLPYSIPSYLVALAVGDLRSARIGPRSFVWTEPCMLETCKAELDGIVEEFISVGERLFGPYVWEKYDVLVMPPSFPFGGMENPCLTFVTPCIIVGDKSLTDVIIHEISHSWFGNLVTNANWSEFWLNEGFTMFAQRRITEEIFGEAYKCLEASTGQALLRQHIQDSGEDDPLNRLRVIIEPGVDPDDTYNETPYEKGFAFVSYLQSLVGDKKKFDDFLKSYVSNFKFKVVVAEDMFKYFLDYFPDLKNSQVDKRSGFEFTTWLTTPGWPPYTPDLSAGKELTEPAEQLASYWAGEVTQIPDFDIRAWKTYQILHFLDKVLEKTSLRENAIQDMCSSYPYISQTHNAEIRLRWSQITIKYNFTPDFVNVQNFLRDQGKQKYTLPIYKALMKGSTEAQALAHSIFLETKSQLHISVQQYVKKILQSTD